MSSKESDYDINALSRKVNYGEGNVRRVLSLDGGGVRGLIQAQFLERMEKKIGKNVHTLFDCYCGTSIGGAIAAGLAIGLDMKKIKDLFSLANLNSIFDKSTLDETFNLAQFYPKYDGINKTKLLREIFGESCMSDISKDKLLIIPVFDLRQHKIIWFTSRDSNEKIADVVDWATNAPAYFPYKTIKDEHGVEISPIDAGVNMNNPSLLALSLYKKMLNVDEPLMISLGTGKHNVPIVGMENVGGLQWMASGNLINVIMDQNYVHKIAKNLLPSYKYCRVNAVLESEIMLDATDDGILKKLKNIGNKLFNVYGNGVISILDSTTL